MTFFLLKIYSILLINRRLWTYFIFLPKLMFSFWDRQLVLQILTGNHKILYFLKFSLFVKSERFSANLSPTKKIQDEIDTSTNLYSASIRTACFIGFLPAFTSSRFGRYRYVCFSSPDVHNREVQIWLPIPVPRPYSIFQPIRCAGPTRLTNQIV